MSLFSAENYTIDDARSASLGGASVSLVSFDNPSANSLLPQSRISVHYSNPFGVKQLSTVSSYLFLSNKLLDAGIILSHFGFEKYNETRFSANFSKKLSSHLSMGIRLNYFSLLMAVEEGRKTVVGSDIGFLIAPLPTLRIGMTAQNLIRTSYSTARGEFELPLSLRLGANCLLTKECLLVGELQKNAVDKPLVKVGFEYLPLSELAVRVGMLNDPFRPTFGVGYAPGKLVFDVASVYHTVLGFHTQVSMSYKF